jgi:cell wall-associated NlpC family hydrolase
MTAQEIKARLKVFARQAVGVPFTDRGRDRAGWDCWGLILAAYKECFGLDLPYGSTFSCHDPMAAGEALLEGAQAWQEIASGREQPGDVLLTRPCHASLIWDRGKMLNCREGLGTIIERYDNSVWERSIIGIYRHAQLAAD